MIRLLRRRRGWALRRYRGEHRDRVLTVAEISADIDAQVRATRAAHLRSLRRFSSADPTAMVNIGTHVAHMKFYGVPQNCPADQLGKAWIEILPHLGDTTVPVLRGADFGAEDASTGPIWLGPELGHEQRMARIERGYAAVKQQFDAGVTREVVSRAPARAA